MDFFELNAFLNLSQTLHFAHTAEKVNLSPSALSRLISRLEDETGTILLERNNREVKLTPQGADFARFAKKCLDEIATDESCKTPLREMMETLNNRKK